MDSCIIDVDENINRMPEGATAEAMVNWQAKIDFELKSMLDNRSEVASLEKHSIYKIPPSIFRLNEEVYTPRAVSLGPYHFGKKDLEAMQGHKHQALVHFLNRSGKTIEPYLEAFDELIDYLRGAYDQLDGMWQNNAAFLNLMILDGCFLLEILRTASDEQTLHDYEWNDPIFSSHGKLYIFTYLRCEMLMLENQLPMLDAQEAERHVADLITGFFRLFFNQRSGKYQGKCLHLLDAYRKILIGEKQGTELSDVRYEYGRLEKACFRICKCIYNNFQDNDEVMITRSATELYEAGIRFKKSRTKGLADISFNNGILELPPTIIDDTTKSIYLNLMALERFHVGLGNEVTSYVCFMDKLIYNDKDVVLLHSTDDIIQNALGSNNAAAYLFNSITRDVTTVGRGDRLEEVHKNLCAHCKRPWNQISRWRANCGHKYFTNPWACISLFAAIFLFALALLQTVFTVLSFRP